MSSASPRRRQSPAVYRRRRLVLLIALLVIVAVVWLLIAQPWRGRADEGTPVSATATPSTMTALPAVSTAPTPTPTSAATKKPSPSATSRSTSTPSPGATAAAKACPATDISVEAVADKTSYATGQNPKLSIKLTNEGSAACTFNVGTTTQSFTITSGSDTWWRSTDCQTTPSDMIVLLKAGQTVASSQPVVWDRTRSSVSTCKSTSRPRAGGGGATYHLQVSIGGVPSHGDTMFLLY